MGQDLTPVSTGRTLFEFGVLPTVSGPLRKKTENCKAGHMATVSFGFHNSVQGFPRTLSPSSTHAGSFGTRSVRPRNVLLQLCAYQTATDLPNDCPSDAPTQHFTTIRHPAAATASTGIFPSNGRATDLSTVFCAPCSVCVSSLPACLPYFTHRTAANRMLRRAVCWIPEEIWAD
ncbi:uncharacterized protein K452DRAFT_28413 [Aplosporella prunicola CBS 121167]|uniref:Uncharacterized protein n=1 Tax=Aplosporella prunicola CBS 121167 TaxID=1176127 RepID=A0A6A6BDG0_9PEZI|nr:uncharacterized protein K452DRAFT_28413 [Aplosporella prunicola CBS 121167]KAF2142219.1 hypothetical protein K452DRAFT_28413 [Aplosporella prunicola CBS 121167]